MNGKADAFCNVSYLDYKGKNRYEVRHPAYQPVIFAAPDEKSALVAAAEYCGRRWVEYSYYAYTEVTKV